MPRPEEEDWTFVSPEPTPEHVRNEQTQTEYTTDSDIDVLERFDIGPGVETESIVSDFSFLRSSDLQVETCDFLDDFPDEEESPVLDLSPGSKAYSHIPNQSVNSQLTVILIMSVAAVAGMAVGNYLGWSKSPSTDFSAYHQLLKLKQLQEELSTCKEHQVDGMNSSCLVSNPAPRCESPIISSAIISVPKLASVSIQVRPPVALSGFVQQKIAIDEIKKIEKKEIVSKNNGFDKLESSVRKNTPKANIVVVQNSNDGSDAIIIETRKYFPLNVDDDEKSGITVWLLLSQNGISRPLFTSGLRRMRDIKNSHLDPFIELGSFPGNKYTIWPEEVGVSLVKADQEGIKNVARKFEIEKEAKEGATGRFWAKVIKKVYRRGKRFSSKLELEDTITDVLLMLRQEYFTHLWQGFERKVAKLKRGRKKF